MPTDCGEIRLFLSFNNLHTGSINSNEKKLERSETLILRKRPIDWKCLHTASDLNIIPYVWGLNN